MNRFGTRVVILFALAATFPVALTALVWLGVSRWDAAEESGEAALARVQLSQLDERRKIAIDRFCRDDLVIDTLLDDRARETPPNVDYDRLFRGTMQAAGLQVLWVLDSLSGEVIARGHRSGTLGRNGAELMRQARIAKDRAFVFSPGDREHQSFVLRSCSIARGGAEVTVVGGHRFSELRSLDPDQLVIGEKALKGDQIVAELADAEGLAQNVVVWRSGVDRRGPPLLLWIVSVAVLALGLALLFGGYLNRWLQTSVEELTEAATRVGRGDFDTTLRDGLGGAFPATATAFNRMTRDLRNARERLRQTERIAAWQEIAQSLAHELKNPLSPIRLSIETLRKAHERSLEDFDAMFDESTRIILQEVERLRSIVDEFSRFARLPAPQRRTTDLGEVLSHVASLHAEGEAPVGFELPDASVVASVDSDQITQVLHNLLQNARDAARSAHPDGGALVRMSLEGRGDTAYIRIEDNGSGIPADQLEAVFEPYYTRKESGTGLGLAIAQRIVREHGGRIDVESQAGRTVFTVVLPRR